MKLGSSKAGARSPAITSARQVLDTSAWLALCVLLLQGLPAAAAGLHARIVDQAGKPVEDAVVLAKHAGEGGAGPARPADDLVDQVDKDFVPYVKPILVGSRVHFPNKDNIRHHVYSFSPAKKFELPLYSGTSAPPVLFDKPGIVVLCCNIHDWMIGYIYVSETPYFGKTAKEGEVVIKDLPSGSYEMRVWHPRMRETEESTIRHSVIGRTGTIEAEWQITLNPDSRIRRAPVTGAGRYR
jgi:plastocyanin